VWGHPRLFEVGAEPLRWRVRIDGSAGPVSSCLGLVVGNAVAAATGGRRVEIVGSDGTVAALRCDDVGVVVTPCGSAMWPVRVQRLLTDRELAGSLFGGT
jgi:hypothetical protein